MHSKIKEIRIRLGLSEAQISSLLNISSYKYRRYENGSLSLTAEVLVLLSIMYNIPIDLLAFDRFSMALIFKEVSMIELLQLSEEERISVLEANMCKYCAFKCNVINYRVVKNILSGFLKNFAMNLQKLRCSRLFEISELASLLQSSVEYYVNLESGKIWPSVYDLVELSSFFAKTINEILGIKNDTDT